LKQIVPRKAPGLPQSEIAGNEKDHNNNPNDVKNIVHLSFSFLSHDRISVEPDAHNITARASSGVSHTWTKRLRSERLAMNSKRFKFHQVVQSPSPHHRAKTTQE
jgi:hypothetical protein